LREYSLASLIDNANLGSLRIHAASQSSPVDDFTSHEGSVQFAPRQCGDRTCMLRGSASTVKLVQMQKTQNKN
jgi:hypothetical protein